MWWKNRVAEEEKLLRFVQTQRAGRRKKQVQNPKMQTTEGWQRKIQGRKLKRNAKLKTKEKRAKEQDAGDADELQERTGKETKTGRKKHDTQRYNLQIKHTFTFRLDVYVYF